MDRKTTSANRRQSAVVGLSSSSSSSSSRQLVVVVKNKVSTDVGNDVNQSQSNEFNWWWWCELFDPDQITFKLLNLSRKPLFHPHLIILIIIS